MMPIPASRRGTPRRVLLVEANDMPLWVGGDLPVRVHVLPIGLMYVAASLLRDVHLADVRILESSLDAATDEALVSVLEDFRPDVVGIRSIVFFVDEVRRIARLAREHAGATVVAGGPVVQALKRELFDRVPELDLAVKGEGERTFARWLAGEPASALDGVLYRCDGQVVENDDAAEIDDLDLLPDPAYELVDLGRYEQQLSYTYNHRRQGVLVTGRGCAYDCTFCFRHPGRLRLRSAGSVFAEMVRLHERHGVSDFYIVDDIFNVDQRRALDLFDRLKGAGLRVRLYFANGLRADITSELFVDRAIEAGAIWFTYAVESASEDIQRLTRKRLNLDRARHVIDYTQRQGVAVNISTMYGFPTETLEQARLTLDWLGTLPRPTLLPYHFCLRFFPGCEIRTQALAAGWSEADLDASSECSYHDFPMRTPTLSRTDMAGLVEEYHRRFGLANREALAGAVQTLRRIGYSDTEISHLYSVLVRRTVPDVAALLSR